MFLFMILYILFRGNSCKRKDAHYGRRLLRKQYLLNKFCEQKFWVERKKIWKIDAEYLHILEE
jgi:hypothetical protein